MKTFNYISTMAIKKKTATGPKAKLMKKNLTQLKAQAKRLKIKGFSTKKKDALVKSIMMAEARKQKSKAPKKSMGASGSMKRMVKKRGAMPDRVMKKPVRPGARKLKSITRKPMMSEYNGWSNYETWNINLWWDNTFVDLVEDYFGETRYETWEVADYLKDFVEDSLEEQNPYAFDNWWGDATRHYLRQVNWSEIAESVIDTING